MFGTLLGVQRSSRYRWLWIGLALWGAFCLLISGRRKMIGMLLIFGGVYVALKLRNAGMGRTVPLFSMLSAIVLAFVLVLYTTEGTQDYITYAQTLVTGSTERLTDNVFGGAIETIRQSGLLGIGLGTATQGNYYASGSSIPPAWQEDGFSRIFAEFGLLGAILVLLAVMNFGKAFRMALKMVPPHAAVREIQLGLTGVIAASGASFIIAHQTFSGDPFSLLFVFQLAGVVLSGPMHREAPLSRPVRATNRSFARQQPMAMSGPGPRR